MRPSCPLYDGSAVCQHPSTATAKQLWEVKMRFLLLTVQWDQIIRCIIEVLYLYTSMGCIEYFNDGDWYVNGNIKKAG